MPSINFCEECEIEFRVKHDADKEYFTVTYCPFCGVQLAVEEQYHFEEQEEDIDE
jgi:hydrogenase maturation factor HypF (carbamoyltransferase family)